MESQEHDTVGPGLPDRSFDGASSSLGVLWQPGEDYSFGASISRSVKMPNAEELYSNGLHAATQAFEVGDPNLDEEVSLGVDLSLRKRTGRLTGELSLFGNRFDGFIFEAFTGDEEEGFPIVVFSQADAEFVGAELDARISLIESAEHHLDLEFLGDVVRAELCATGEPLPRIPPARYGAALHYQRERWSGRAEVRRVEEQDRVAANETATGGHTLLNASLGYRFFAGQQVLDLLLRGRNLTDEEARNHASFLKDRVPVPGRDASLSLHVAF